MIVAIVGCEDKDEAYQINILSTHHCIIYPIYLENVRLVTTILFMDIPEKSKLDQSPRLVFLLACEIN